MQRYIDLEINRIKKYLYYMHMAIDVQVMIVWDIYGNH